MSAEIASCDFGQCTQATELMSAEIASCDFGQFN